MRYINLHFTYLLTYLICCSLRCMLRWCSGSTMRDIRWDIVESGIRLARLLDRTLAFRRRSEGGRWSGIWQVRMTSCSAGTSINHTPAVIIIIGASGTWAGAEQPAAFLDLYLARSRHAPVDALFCIYRLWRPPKPANAALNSLISRLTNSAVRAPYRCLTFL